MAVVPPQLGGGSPREGRNWGPPVGCAGPYFYYIHIAISRHLDVLRTPLIIEVPMQVGEWVLTPAGTARGSPPDFPDNRQVLCLGLGIEGPSNSRLTTSWGSCRTRPVVPLSRRSSFTQSLDQIHDCMQKQREATLVTLGDQIVPHAYRNEDEEHFSSFLLDDEDPDNPSEPAPTDPERAVRNLLVMYHPLWNCLVELIRQIGLGS